MKCRQLMSVFLLLFPVILLASDMSPDQIIRKVENRLASEKSIKIVFLESFIWKLTGEGQGMGGELIMKGDQCFRITTDDQVIVSNGTILWTYDRLSNQVMIDRLDETENSMLPRQILLQYSRDYNVYLLGEKEIDGNVCYELEFTSESGTAFMSKVRVWVDKKEWIPRKIEQTGIDENVTTYDLKEILFDISVNDQIFSFEIPEDAEVIDMR